MLAGHRAAGAFDPECGDAYNHDGARLAPEVIAR
jgi:hypothetical protein